jgi:hypothetical protein
MVAHLHFCYTIMPFAGNQLQGEKDNGIETRPLDSQDGAGTKNDRAVR